MAKRAGAVKPLNEPAQVSVRTDQGGLPVAVQLVTVIPTLSRRGQSRPRGANSSQSKWLKVSQIEDIYEVDELWWRGKEQEIQRLYFDLRLDNSRKVTVYRDLINDIWFRQAD